MNAVLAFIADGGRAIIVIDRERLEINYFLLYFIDTTKTLRRRPWASSNPFRVGSRGWGTLVYQNHAAGREIGSIMVGMFVSYCLVSQSLLSGSFLFPTEWT